MQTEIIWKLPVKPYLVSIEYVSIKLANIMETEFVI